MDSTNMREIFPALNVIECPTNLKSDEDSARIEAGEPSVEIDGVEISVNSDGKHTKKSTKDTKLPLKRKQVKDASSKIKTAINSKCSGSKSSRKMIKDGELPLKRTMRGRIPMSQMVKDAIKALRKRKGASVEAILQYMEGQNKVDAKLVKRYVTKYIQSAVQKGVLEQMIGTGEEGRFKIKKAEKVAKIGQKLKIDREMEKAPRK